MVECPSISETILGFTLLLSSNVAHVCRRSWKRISVGPARFRSGLNERRVRLWRLMGLPVSDAQMRPISKHREPTALEAHSAAAKKTPACSSHPF